MKALILGVAVAALAKKFRLSIPIGKNLSYFCITWLAWSSSKCIIIDLNKQLYTALMLLSKTILLIM
jgi:hypothetical protein